jgi:hypothetical protein
MHTNDSVTYPKPRREQELLADRRAKGGKLRREAAPADLAQAVLAPAVKG